MAWGQLIDLGCAAKEVGGQISAQRRSLRDQTAFVKVMKDGFTTEKSPQPITNCRRCILLPKDLCSSLIKLVAVAANLPHELAGLLGREVMLAGKVVDAIGASDSRRRMSFFRFFRFAMPTAFSIIGSSELSIAEIAISSGFADQSHFTRVYAQMTGTSPGAWRRMRTPRLSERVTWEPVSSPWLDRDATRESTYRSETCPAGLKAMRTRI